MKGAKWRALFCFIVALAAGCFAAACAEEHVHEYEAVVTPPTCTEQGYTTYTCPEDGDSYIDDYVDATGHTSGEAVEENKVAATCTAEGSYEEVVYCTVCDEEISRKQVTVEKLAHTPGTAVREKEIAATCTAEGSYEEVVYCTVCDEELSRKQVTVEKADHTPGTAVREKEVAATCTAEGSYEEVVYCTACGEEISRKQVTVDKVAHTPGTAVREKEVAATCTTEGSYEEVVYCTICEEELSRETVTVDKTGHTPEALPGKAATCTETGLTEGSKCSVCGTVLKAQEVISASGHSWGEWTQTKAPTCTTAGEEQRVCNNDPKHVETQVISASGHSWTESAEAEYLVSAATCTAKAVYYKSCSVCGAKGTETFEHGELAAHKSETIPGKAATCTETGLTDGEKCSVCGTVLKAQEEIPASGHSWGEWTQTKAPTCTAVGEEQRVCNNDPTHVETRVISASGHSWTESAEAEYLVSAATCTAKAVYYKSCSVCGAASTETFAYGDLAGHMSETIPGKAATCTETGLTDGEKCSVCGTVLKAQEEIPASGHSWTESAEAEYLVSAATCTAKAVYYKSCSACGTKSEETFAYGELASHTPVIVPGKAATCTEAGLTEGSKCSVCGTVLKEQEEIPAKGHTPSEAKKENEKTATCTEAGSYDEVVYCSVCKEEISRKHVQTAALGHAWGSGAVTTAPTCSATGVRTYTCSRCDAKRTENIPMTAHTPVTVPGKAATCSAPGLTEGSKCSLCGEVLQEQQKIEALSHTFNGNAVCTVCGGIDMSMPEKGSGSTVAVHDPSVIIAYVDNYGIVYPTKEDGRGLTKVYFVFGTQLAAAYSFDMESWAAFTPTFYEEGTETVSADYYKVFNTVADWSGYKTSATVKDNTWAPDIIYNTDLGKWCVYYSLSGDGNRHKQSSVYMMTSSSITGPYEYAGSVVYSGMTNETSGAGNADYQKVTKEDTIADRYLTGKAWSNNYGVHCIDPAVMYDKEGELWLFYGSWSGGIALLKLDNQTGLRDLDYNYGYEGNGAVWEGTSLVYDPYMGIHIAGGWWVSGEGPYVEYIDGYYYLFMSYGGYAPDGGYNMRVFRSKDIRGRYTDPDGTWAVYGESNNNNFGADVTHGLSFMQNYKWSWWTGPASLSQGHNSAVVDTDGNAYLVYHIKYDDGTDHHNVEVHRLVKAAAGEDSWYLVAPFQKSGYDRIVTDAEIADLAGGWNVLIHRPIANYGAMEYNTDVAVTLNADGFVTGAYTGSWSINGQYITITLEGEGTFSGVLMEQQIEGIDGKQLTYTFTAMNESSLCIWGARFTDEMAAQLMADRITFPDTILGDLKFETQGLWGTTIAYSSSNTDVLANDGTFTAPAKDTNLTLTVTVSIGSASITKEKTFTIKGLSEASILGMLPDAIRDDGYLVKAEPGAGGSIGPVSELSTYTGVSFTFRVKDVKTDWDVMFRTANGTQVYLSVLNFNNANTFEASATLSEAGKAILEERGLKTDGTDSWQLFLGSLCENGECVATISYNVDGSIAFYRNGVLMLTYAADTAIGTGTVSDLVNTMVAQVRTQGLSVVYPVSNVIVAYAADYDESKVPEERPVIETLGKDNGDGTYTLKFDTWYLEQEVKGDFKVVYDFNVKSPKLLSTGDNWYTWEVKIGDWKLRADSYSMDGANNNASLGSAVTHNGNPVDWADFRNAYLNADVILTIERTGLSVTATAKVSSLSTGEEFTYTATYASFGTQDTTVSLGGEDCLISVYNVTAESGEGPVEPEFPKAYPAMPDVAETGLSVSFTLANAVYEAGSPDSTWNALLSAGGYVITFGNLDAFSTTGSLKGMNLYPSNSQFGGVNWNGLFDQGTIEVMVNITKNDITFFRNGMPIIKYVRTSSVEAEQNFVGAFIDAFLAEVEKNGFTFAEVAYDITNVVVGMAQETVDFEVGAADNSTGYTGNTPLWTSTIQQGQKITVSGTATSSGANVYNSPFAYLWTGDTASLNFRADNWVNGVDEGLDQSGTEANVADFNFYITKMWKGFDPATANGSDWVASLISHYQQEFTCTITWDYSEANKIVVQYSFKWENATFNQQYTITPLSGNLLNTYSIGLGVDCAYYHVTGMTVE